MTTFSHKNPSQSEQGISESDGPVAIAARQDFQKRTIAIAATFTAEPLEESLAYWMQELALPSTINFAPYNQLFQQLLDPTSLLANNQRGINVILLRFEDWQRFATDAEQNKIDEEKLERSLHELTQALHVAAKRSATPYLVCVCPASPEVDADARRRALFAYLEDRAAEDLAEISGVYLIKSAEVNRTYPVSQIYDQYGDKIGHMPYTPLFFAALGTLVARKIYALLSNPYKVIVVDCDQTLWQGVCGEDGATGVIIDGLRMQFQEFLVAQQAAGMLLCLCSKNNEQDVFDVFACHPHMQLKREHLVAWRINWQPKSQNLRSLAEELQLSLESFIFIDDSPMECAEVQTNCPEVLTLPLPQDISRLPHLLQHFWAFDHLRATTEDKQRTDLYMQQLQRQAFQKASTTLKDFLEGLELHVRITLLKEAQLDRVAQLTQRTNQFNCTTFRRTESEIRQFCQAEKGGRGECLVVEVSDRFGDYGLVGVILFEVRAEEIEVDTFLLSCRALGRGVEHRMLAKLGEIAHERGVLRVLMPFIPTSKNTPAREFLEGREAITRQVYSDRCWFSFATETLTGLVYTPPADKSVNPDEEPSDINVRRGEGGGAEWGGPLWSPAVPVYTPPAGKSVDPDEEASDKSVRRGSLPDSCEQQGRARTQGTRKGPSIPDPCEQREGGRAQGTRKGPRIRTPPPLPLHTLLPVTVGTGVDGRWQGAPCGCPPLRPLTRRHSVGTGVDGRWQGPLHLASLLTDAVSRRAASLERWIAASGCPPCPLLLRIATELSTAEQVLQAIAAQRRQHPGAQDQVTTPRTWIEEQLVEIWAEVLKLDLVDIHDDFIALGGSSLHATQIASRLYASLQIEVPLRSIFEAPTVAQLAEIVTYLQAEDTAPSTEEAKTDSRTPIVAMQTGGSRRPFFFLHGQWSGDAFYSLRLARHLGSDQPFYLLEPYKFDGLVMPPTFEAIATAHIQALRRIQPEGPYLLGGWCNGGLMAYEMARQLHAQGQTVDLLVMMDPDSPARSWKWERRFIIHLGNLLRRKQKKQVDWFLSYRYLRLSFHYWRLNKRKHMRTPRQGEPKSGRSSMDPIPAQLDTVSPRNEILRHDWLSIYDWVLADYMPHPYAGKITFFWTDEELFRREIWRKVMDSEIEANNVETHVIPGNHITSRTQYLSVLAEQLCECVNKAQRLS